jgi:hypothetical protein
MTEDPKEDLGSAETVDAALAETRATKGAGPMLLEGTTLGERYKLVRLLGTGGMGAVYQATDLTLGKDVALKILHTGEPGWLKDEVLLAQRVTHRNVCRTYDLEEAGGRHVIKMEYVAGQSLAAELKGPASVAHTLAVARAVCDGLDAAHREGVVHRDLKPQNILVEAVTGRIVLMDFGIARLTQDAGGGTFAGTPAYMAPEQFAGGAVDARADLYALGCVLFEMLAGKLPFPGKTVAECARLHREAPPPPLPHTPAWLARVVHRLLEKDPDRRPATARAVLALFEPRRRWPWIAGALTVLAAIGIVGLRWPHPSWRPKVLSLEAYDGTVGDLELSPDGKVLATVSDRESQPGLFIEPLGGGEARRAPIAGRILAARWAPDGQSLYYNTFPIEVGRLPLAEGAIEPIATNEYLLDTCGDDLLLAFGGRLILRASDGTQRLYTAPDGVSGARCDPGARRITYTDDADRLWISAIDGSDRRLLAEHAAAPVFAADGRSVLYAATGADKNIFEVSARGGRPVRVTFDDGPDFAPSPSGDGRLLAYLVDRTFLQVVVVARGEKRRLTTRPEAIDSLAEAPDGRDVVVSTLRDGQPSVVIFPTDHPSDGRLLARGSSPIFSGDGTEVVFIAPGAELRAVPRGGGDARPVCPIAADDVYPLRSDERSVYYLDRSGEERVPLAGGTPELVAPDHAVVLPAAGGWRVAWRWLRSRDLEVRLVPPNAQVDDPSIAGTLAARHDQPLVRREHGVVHPGRPPDPARRDHRQARRVRAGEPAVREARGRRDLRRRARRRRGAEGDHELRRSPSAMTAHRFLPLIC